ncbi:DUF1345 domain-containing protein [Oryzifoliimicrobium ureilyticus]|uniref:DUF1345 domain-containing protein n=1 Tax=Oryzifoliimicrobium ureilyticus TaxID=3113724 RepID=UPI00307650F7
MRIAEAQPRKNSFSRLIRKHLAFSLAVLAGVVIFLLLTSRTINARNLLLGWNGGALVFIAFIWRRMLYATVDRIKQRADNFDFSDRVLLGLSILAAIASVGGIIIELNSVKDASPDVAIARAGVAILTIIISWVFLHTLFTVHYAHRYYRASDRGAGLKFPDDIESPLYWDFLYFSFTIGVAAQTADIGITSTEMRRLALLHAVLSFLFNTTILALAVNVGASLI